LPGLILVLSLLAFEQTFGLVGLFLSFPSLYVATRIHREWSSEDLAISKGATPPAPPAAGTGAP
jgi:predicted PurR-regulated permease PerM